MKRILILLALMVGLLSCKKNENPVEEKPISGNLPTVTTVQPTVASMEVTRCGGKVMADGGLPLLAVGVCWNTSPNPTVANKKTVDGKEFGEFESTMIGMTPKTTYYIRAYATNAKGTAYGEEKVFFNENDQITLKLSSFSKSAHAEYQVIMTSNNEKGLVLDEVGICWTSNPKPTIYDYKSPIYAPDKVLHIEWRKILRPEANTKVYIRPYAITNKGTFYGEAINFDTPMDYGYLYRGGHIAYMNAEKTHGLVISERNLGKAPWAPGNWFATETFATSNSDGMANTNQIITRYGSGAKFYAAFLCKDYRGGGFSDWYLPSIDELSLLIQNGLKSGFDGDAHWSSSEYSYQSGKYINFSNMYTTPIFPSVRNEIKKELFSVRAIRAF